MIGLEVRFLAGRFHGNSWHHAHNEGIPEWPPSPWRVLRALVSAGYAEQLPIAEVGPLINRLRPLPRYKLPLAVDAHTRHYMPDTDDAQHTKAKVFDAFVAIEGGARDPQPVTLAWPVDLTVAERELLVRLSRRVAYLGRAESWAELSVVNLEEREWDCWPDESVDGAASTTLLALASADELEAWSRRQPVPRKGLDVPRTMWDVLTFEGRRYRSEGWSDLPGTRRARYVFARPPFRRSVVPRPTRHRSAPPTVVRYAIRSAVLPRLHDAVSIGERLRVAAMSRSRQVSGDAHDVFTGHGVGDSNHRHAMYLATSEIQTNRERGYIDHLTISAPAGFDEEDVVALQRLRRLWGRGGHDLELILLGLGQPADFGGMKSPYSRVLAESRVWESVTPFIPTRHPKVVRGVEIDGIELQIRRGCRQLRGIEPIEVTSLEDRAKWSAFRRRRVAGGGRRGVDRAYGARLVFDRPVQGPLALGYGAHFGLGLFVAADADE